MGLKQYYSNLWILSNPIIIYRVLRGFVRAFIFKKNTLKTIELYPTFECQAKCIMCSIEKYKNSKKDFISLNDYELIAKQGSKMGAIALTILGGEPLLSKDIEGIIKIFKRFHYFITIVSNGISITENKIDKLKKAGLNSIYFSLDSLDEKVNDKIRGFKGYYKKVMESIEICKKKSLLVGLAKVIFPGEVDEYIKLLEYCKKNNLLASGGEVAVVGAGENEGLVSKEENMLIRRLLKKYPRLTFDWALSYFLKIRCPAGKEKIGITCFGDVIGCSLNPISFGNIKDESLYKIWLKMQHFSQYKKDSERCLPAGDMEFIDNYIMPIKKIKTNPVYFKDHPNIDPESEPEIFNL